MILTCPQCQTRFLVPSTAIRAEGRKVRCAQCKHEWVQFPETKAQDAVGQAATPVYAASKEENPSKTDTVSTNVIWGWIVPFVVGLAMVLVVFFVVRMTDAPLIMGQGLAFDNVALGRIDDGIVVTGTIVNTMNDVRGVPSIQITALYDDIEGDVVYVQPSVDRLDPGESIEFIAGFPVSDAMVTDIKVTFRPPAAN